MREVGEYLLYEDIKILNDAPLKENKVRMETMGASQ